MQWLMQWIELIFSIKLIVAYEGPNQLSQKLGNTVLDHGVQHACSTYYQIIHLIFGLLCAQWPLPKMLPIDKLHVHDPWLLTPVITPDSDNWRVCQSAPCWESLCKTQPIMCFTKCSSFKHTATLSKDTTYLKSACPTSCLTLQPFGSLVSLLKMLWIVCCLNTTVIHGHTWCSIGACAYIF